MSDRIIYSEVYEDKQYQYRVVNLPIYLKYDPKKKLTELEWRKLGIDLASGWENYMPSNDEHALLFRKRIK